MSELNHRQKLFCKYYIANNCNAADAARQAGYSEKTARIQGSTLLTKPNIQAQIKKEIEKALSDVDMLKLKWLQQVTDIAFFDMRKAASWNDSSIEMIPSDQVDDATASAITEVSSDVTKYGSSVKIKAADKNKALDLLGKYLAILTESVPAPTDDDTEKMSRKERQERIAQLTRKMRKQDAN